MDTNAVQVLTSTLWVLQSLSDYAWCTNWCKWRVSSGCTVRLPHWNTLIAFISANHYLLAHQLTLHEPRLVQLYGFFSKTKAPIDRLPSVKPQCGAQRWTTILWINRLLWVQHESYREIQYWIISQRLCLRVHASVCLCVSVLPFHS